MLSVLGGRDLSGISLRRIAPRHQLDRLHEPSQKQWPNSTSTVVASRLTGVDIALFVRKHVYGLRNLACFSIVKTLRTQMMDPALAITESLKTRNR
jgi:hypothetical protein